MLRGMGNFGVYECDKCRCHVKGVNKEKQKAMAVPNAQSERLSQAQYVYHDTDARSRNQFCRDKNKCS